MCSSDLRLKVDDPGLIRDLAAVLELRGMSVTIPHKQALMASLDEADAIAAAIGAANTVTVRDGRLLGSNTDILAAMEAVKEAAVKKWSHGIYGMRALVLGAGFWMSLGGRSLGGDCMAVRSVRL